MAALYSFFSNIRFADALDLAVISVFVYFLLTWLQHRASRTLVIGIALLAFLYGAARIMQMYMTLMLFQAGFTAALVILVVIFQDEIRSTLERIISWRNYRLKHELVASPKTTETLVETMVNLARDKIGALVVIKGRQSLERHLNGGISLNGRISIPLLYSIFHPKTPCHDGAVVVEADRIDKFNVRLPLSHNLHDVRDAGTRHSAGLGIAECSDALVIVVSEERGTISLAQGGRLRRVDKNELRAGLEEFYLRIFPPPVTAKHHLKLTHNTILKAASIALALLLWVGFAYRTGTVTKTFTVPVEYRGIPSDWVIEAPVPAAVQLSLCGMERSFDFDPSRLAVSIDMSRPRENFQTIALAAKDAKIPAGLKVNQITPHSIALRAYQVKPIDVPVKVVTRGQVAENLAVTEIVAHPSTIRILVPEARISSIANIVTEPVLLEDLTQTTALRLKLEVPAEAHLEDPSQNAVKVNVVVRQKGK